MSSINTSVGLVMSEDQELSSSPPLPRSLRTIKGARLELARLYRQTKTGEIDPLIAGKLAHILNILISSARDGVLEERLNGIEQRLALVKPNGQDNRGRRP